MKKCPVCNQAMDFIVTSFRNKPFVDGKNYATMCFGCAWVPLDYVQTYNKEGSIDETEGPFFDHKHLSSPEELFEQGSVASLTEARKCVNAVKRKIKEVGVRVLNKESFKRPKMEYSLVETPIKKTKKRTTKKTKKKKVRAK